METSSLQEIEKMVRHGQLTIALEELNALESSGVLEGRTKTSRWRILERIITRKYKFGENISISPKLRFLILKSTVLEELGEADKAQDVCILALQEARKDERHLASKFDALLNQASVLCNISKNNESLDVIDEGLRIWDSLDIEQQEFFESQRASFLHYQGKNYRIRGELDKALEYLLSDECIGTFKRLGDKLKIAQTSLIAGICKFYQSNLEEAYNLFHEALALFEELEYKKEIASCLNTIAEVYHYRGLLDKAIDYQFKSLSIKEEINHAVGIAISLNNIGELYIKKHELEKALDYLERSKAMFMETGNRFYEAHTLDALIPLALELSKREKADVFLQRLVKIDDSMDSPNISHKRKVSEAVLLKTSSRTRNRGLAEELLNQVTNDEVTDYVTTVKAMLHLSHLLINELKDSGDKEILREINANVEKLQEIAKNQRSYSLLTETYIIKSKLALLNLDMKNASKFLVQAELMANEYGYEQLAMQISLEHDKLLEMEKEFEETSKSVSISKLMDLSDLEHSVDQLTKVSREQISDIPHESPVMLMVFTNSGLCIYSKIFDDNSQEIDEHLFTGFISALNVFGDEVFSSNLDRVRLGDFTLAMSNIGQNLLCCYVFTGPSYHAVQKLNTFVETISASIDQDTYGLVENALMQNQLDDDKPIQELIAKVF